MSTSKRENPEPLVSQSTLFRLVNVSVPRGRALLRELGIEPAGVAGRVRLFPASTIAALLQAINKAKTEIQ